jgi:putative tryptophan/tyrosine transport system substrate-binding protein
MRRRNFIAGLGVAAIWPFDVRAQQSSVLRRIGVLVPQAESDSQAQAELAEFRQVLRDLGWTDGGTAQFRVYWAGSDLGRIRNSAQELVAWQPDGRADEVIE